MGGKRQQKEGWMERREDGCRRPEIESMKKWEGDGSKDLWRKRAGRRDED